MHEKRVLVTSKNDIFTSENQLFHETLTPESQNNPLQKKTTSISKNTEYAKPVNLLGVGYHTYFETLTYLTFLFMIISIFALTMGYFYAKNFMGNTAWLNSKMSVPSIAGVSESGPHCI